MKTNAVVHRLPITKARVNLGQVVRRVRLNKEYFILEKDGIPIAGIMGAEELEDYLELRDPKISEHIRKSHEDFLAGRHRPAEDLLKELKQPRVKKRTGTRP
jgi:antitoxin (DNA-binding transcriptional repressor) of toxin-antitoxin stability system